MANAGGGLAAARARGRNGSRRPKLNGAQATHAQQFYDGRQHTVAQIAALLGVARTMVCGHLTRVKQGAAGAETGGGGETAAVALVTSRPTSAIALHSALPMDPVSDAPHAPDCTWDDGSVRRTRTQQFLAVVN